MPDAKIILIIKMLLSVKYKISVLMPMKFVPCISFHIVIELESAREIEPVGDLYIY